MTRRASKVFLAVAFLCACGDSSGPSEPQPGILTVQLTTNATTDRAALIQLSGPGPISSVQSDNAGVMVFSTETGTAVKTIVTGTLTSGALLQFNVEDVNKVKAYNATIVELANNTNALQTNLSGRSLRITK
ncbi:MAG: hypothetical protein WEE89_05175 [Gemmatimonadota bacterium]